jgi:hypothetical protein
VGAGFFKTFDEAAEKTIRLELGPQIGVDRMLEVVHVPLDLFRFEGAGNDADDGRVAKRKLQGRERNRVEICFRKNPQSSHNASTRRARRRAFAGSTELCNASFRAQTDEVRRKRPHPACPP